MGVFESGEEVFVRWLDVCEDPQMVYRFTDSIDYIQKCIEEEEIPISPKFRRICFTSVPLIIVAFGPYGLVIRRFGLVEPLNYSCWHESDFSDINYGSFFPDEAEFYSTEPIPMDQVDAIVAHPNLTSIEDAHWLKELAESAGVEFFYIDFTDEQMFYQMLVSAILSLAACARKPGYFKEFPYMKAVVDCCKVWSERHGLKFCTPDHVIKPEISKEEVESADVGISKWGEGFGAPEEVEVAAKSALRILLPLYFVVEEVEL